MGVLCLISYDPYVTEFQNAYFIWIQPPLVGFWAEVFPVNLSKFEPLVSSFQVVLKLSQSYQS